jgi:nucleoside-diphosphate-sugar epimerase
MASYLVTGGAGFIGSHIVQELLSEGKSVRVLDDFSSGKKKNLEAAAEGARPGQLEVIAADIRDAARLKEAVRGADAVFHEAAFVSVPDSMAKPQDCFDVNCAGTASLLEASREAGVRRVILASSAAVYGDSSDTRLTEESEANPQSPYAASKLAGEIYGGLYARVMDLEVTALRYFNVYGPRQRPDTQYAAAVPIFVRSLRENRPPTVFGDGTQTRDLVFVGDVVRANLIAAASPAAAGQVFNICTGRPTRILDLLEILYALFPQAPKPVFAPARPGDIYASLGSPDKARRVIDFASQCSLVKGLRETVACIQ